MKLLIFVLLPALVSIAGAWTINKRGWIENFIWPEDSKDLTSLKSIEDVTFVNCYIENFSKDIGDQLTKMKKLMFLGETVLEVYLKRNMEELTIYDSKTENIIIDSNEDYAIIHLFVTECELTSIPANLNRLKRLELLYLSGNKIDHVQMSDFNGLNNLKNLWLTYNGMKTLSSAATIHLPMLGLLAVFNNNLREINVCTWDMPNLEEFYFLGNELKFVVNSIDQFPKLRGISAYGNPLICQWRDSMKELAKSKNITGYFGNGPCNASDKTPVPTTCPIGYSDSNQQADHMERQRSFEQSIEMPTSREESVEQMMEEFNDES